MTAHDHDVDASRATSHPLPSPRRDRVPGTAPLEHDGDGRAHDAERAAAVRDLIGQATGILMERHTVDDAAAYRMLIASAREAGTTVLDTAQWLRGQARHRHAESVALPEQDAHETADERDQLEAERAAWGHGTDGT